MNSSAGNITDLGGGPPLLNITGGHDLSPGMKMEWRCGLAITIGATQSVLVVLILIFIQFKLAYNATIARKQSEELASRSPTRKKKRDKRDFLVLPIYYRFIKGECFLAVYRCSLMITMTLMGHDFFSPASGNYWQVFVALQAICMAFDASLRDGVHIFLMQRGAGKRSIRRVSVLTSAWAALHLMLCGCTLFFNFPKHQTLLYRPFWIRCVLCTIFHTCAWCAKQFRKCQMGHKLVSHRPSGDNLSLFNLTVSLLLMSDMVLHSYQRGNAIYEALQYILIGILFIGYIPLLWHTLIIDSRYWRSVGISGKVLQGRNIFEPLLSTDRAITQMSNEKGPRFTANFVIDPCELSWQQQIGGGSFSRVFEGTWNGRKCAIKDLTLDELDEKALQDFCVEAELTVVVGQHHNIVQLFGVSISPPNVCMIMERCRDKTLSDYILAGVSPKDVVGIALGIASALEFSHSKDVLHRDLKPNNVLFSSEHDPNCSLGTVKVCDFGIALHKKPKTEQTRQIFEGTFPYMPPECLKNEAVCTKSDVYSFACILWELTHHVFMWSHVGFNIQIFQQVTSGMRPTIGSDVDPALAQLIEACWTQDAPDRPSFSEIVRTLTQIQRNSILPDRAVDEVGNVTSSSGFSNPVASVEMDSSPAAVHLANI